MIRRAATFASAASMAATSIVAAQEATRVKTDTQSLVQAAIHDVFELNGQKVATGGRAREVLTRGDANYRRFAATGWIKK